MQLSSRRIFRKTIDGVSEKREGEKKRERESFLRGKEKRIGLTIRERITRGSPGCWEDLFFAPSQIREEKERHDFFSAREKKWMHHSRDIIIRQ